MGQKNLLRILFVEDVPSDVDLAVLELRKEKLIFEYTTVCTKNDLLNALSEFNPDLVISDYMMPAFNGLQALKVTKEFNHEIPFILYTGSVNEETAVECIKAGAEDYVIKEHMTRLPFAVKEALEQVAVNKEKRVSELLLKENEEKLQSIFSAAPVGIGLVVNRVLYEVNDSLCRMTGYMRSELIGQSSRILYHSQEEFERAGKEKYEQIAEKGTGSVETVFRCKDASTLNVILSSTPLDIKDHSKGVTFTVLDITERKKSEEALRESQQLFQTLSQVSPVGIFRTKADGHTTYVNPEWLELSGLSEEEALGFGWLKAVHPEDRAQIDKKWQSDVHNRKPSVAEFRFLKTDGTVVWVMGNAVPEIKDNDIKGYIGTITDITERKKTEIALKESENKYRRIFENVQDVYYESALDGTILEVSPSINLISKGLYKMSELTGMSMYDFYSDSYERKQILDALNEKGFVSDFEVMLRNRDDSVIPCSISAKLIFDSDGIPEKIIGSIRDITDRKNASDALRLAKEKAEASDKLKTDFLNNISHEVRTPLNGILGFAEIITLQGLSDEEKKDSLAMLFESSNRLLNTITNYMDISLITSGSLSLNIKEFDPVKILKKLQNIFDTICLNRNLELILDIDNKRNENILNSDPEICQKILSHFLDNAVKFTEKGSIRFGLTSKPDQVEFFVRDTGIGINTQSFNVIFERFSKENIGPYKVSEGSGLGLSIARGMAEAIGGKIRLESEPGAGSCFYLSIPLNKAGAILTVEKSEEKLSTQESISPILVAEDDDTNFYYLNALLIRVTSATILRASNGREAVELFKANPEIKLILMDIKMPEMDGFEATRQIKQIKPEVPIIAITAYAMSGDEDRIIASGCDAYLSKPISKKSLLDKMAEFIKIR